MKLCKDIHGPQRTKPNDFSDPHREVDISCLGSYWIDCHEGGIPPLRRNFNNFDNPFTLKPSATIICKLGFKLAIIHLLALLCKFEATTTRLSSSLL